MIILYYVIAYFIPIQKQLYTATMQVARLREEVAREQALLNRDKYLAYLEEIVNAQVNSIIAQLCFALPHTCALFQFSITPILEASIDKITTEFSELAAAVEATTHRLPTTGIIVPTPDELLHELSSTEQALSDILTLVGPNADTVQSPCLILWVSVFMLTSTRKLGEYAATMEGLTAVLSEELGELEQCKELLTETSMLESQRRSLLIQYIQQHGQRPDDVGAN